MFPLKVQKEFCSAFANYLSENTEIRCYFIFQTNGKLAINMRDASHFSRRKFLLENYNNSFYIYPSDQNVVVDNPTDLVIGIKATLLAIRFYEWYCTANANVKINIDNSWIKEGF